MLSLEELRLARKKRRLMKEEKQAYIEYWQSSRLSQRLFCEQESLPLATFGNWLKSGSRKSTQEATLSGFVAVEVSAKAAKQTPGMALQFKLPNGLVIEGHFLLSELGCFIKELSDGLTPLC